MAQIMSALSTVFNAFFVTTTGTNAHTAYVKQIVDLVVGNDYLLLGVALMVAGTAIGYLSRLIHNT